MSKFCPICFRKPNRFAFAGVPLSWDCLSCADFNGKKYNRERRKENEIPQLDHQEAEPHTNGAQKLLFRPDEAERKTTIE